MKILKNIWMQSAFQHRLLYIVLMGMILRMGWGLVVPIIPVSDSVIYAKTAENITLHGVYGVEPEQPFSYWPVGTAAIYAAGYKVFGMGPNVVFLVNLIASLALIHTSGLLARRWFTEKIALVTAMTLACWPSLIMYVTIYASEVFFIVFVNLGLLAWRMETPRWAIRSIVFGAMIASAAYVRPVSLLLPFLVFAIEVIHNKKFVQPAIALIVVCIVVGGAIAPWSIRNTNLHGGFVLISTNGGTNLWMGNNPNSNGSYMPTPENTRHVSEYERDKILGTEAKKYMLSNLGHSTIMFFKKLFKTHASETIAVHWNKAGLRENVGSSGIRLLKIITQAYWSVVLVLALVGVAVIIKQASLKRNSILQAIANPPLVYWIYFGVLHAVIVAQDRYHFPSIPFIAMLCAMAINFVWPRLFVRQKNN